MPMRRRAGKAISRPIVGVLLAPALDERVAVVGTSSSCKTYAA